MRTGPRERQSILDNYEQTPRQTFIDEYIIAVRKIFTEGDQRLIKARLEGTDYEKLYGMYRALIHNLVSDFNRLQFYNLKYIDCPCVLRKKSNEDELEIYREGSGW